MLKYRIATVAGIAVALPLAAAHAQDEADRSQSPGAALMSMYDDDGDGRLTREEAEATSFEDRFDKMDRNGDGELDEGELEAAYGSDTTRGGMPAGDGQDRLAFTAGKPGLSGSGDSFRDQPRRQRRT